MKMTKIKVSVDYFMSLVYKAKPKFNTIACDFHVVRSNSVLTTLLFTQGGKL